MTTHFAHLARRQHGRVDTGLLNSSSILQIGVGRGLSSTLTLHRSGLGRSTLIDNQAVEPENIGQTVFTAAQVGMTKVAAAKELILSVAPSASVMTYAALAENVAGLHGIMAGADLVKIGIDNPLAQFPLADAAQAANTPAIVHGMTGDGRQFYAALVVPGGRRLRELLPAAWEGVSRGYEPPAFFPSCAVHTDLMNAAVALMMAGVLHHRAGSTLAMMSDVGAGLAEACLATGFNGFHEPSGFLAPIFFGLPE